MVGSTEGRSGMLRILVLSLAIVLGIVAGGVYLFVSKKSAPPVVAEVPLPLDLPIIEEVEEPIVEAPDPVVPEEPVVEETAPPEPVLPPLNRSDEQFKAALAELDGTARLIALLANDQLIRKGVRAVHALSEGYAVKEYRPIASPPGLFVAEPLAKRGPNDEMLFKIRDAGFARYVEHIAALDAVSPEALAQVYRTYYPLLQQAYQELGLPEPDFREVMLKALDQALLPVVLSDEQSVLSRPSVMYVFRDKGVEAMSGLQKLKWRLGPDNAAKVESWVRDFRAALVAGAN